VHPSFCSSHALCPNDYAAVIIVHSFKTVSFLISNVARTNSDEVFQEDGGGKAQGALYIIYRLGVKIRILRYVIVSWTSSGGARIFRLPGHSQGTRIL